MAEVLPLVLQADGSVSQIQAGDIVAASALPAGGGEGGASSCIIGTVQPNPAAGTTVLWIQTNAGAGSDFSFWLVTGT